MLPFRERNWEIDVVVPVPDGSRPSAIQVSSELGLPYREGLVKNRYVGRTFIMPDQRMREMSVRRKLNAMPAVFEGKDVLLIDDSIVRGTTMAQIVDMVRRAGARKVSNSINWWLQMADGLFSICLLAAGAFAIHASGADSVLPTVKHTSISELGCMCVTLDVS